MVFIDETGVNTKLARLYGRSPRGERCRSAIPHGHWQSSTLLAALRHEELTAPFLVDGPLDAEVFLVNLQQVLVPCLQAGDTLILDNLATHKVQRVEPLLRAKGGTISLPATLWPRPQSDRTGLFQTKSAFAAGGGLHPGTTPDRRRRRHGYVLGRRLPRFLPSCSICVYLIPFPVRYCTILFLGLQVGMPKRFHLNRPDRAKEVIAALADCEDVSAQQRLLAMRLACGGQLTAAQIAEQVGISRRQFFNWVGLLKRDGVAGLLANHHRGGPPPKVTGKVLEAFQAGLKVGCWKRAKEIQHWLRREHQVKLGLKGVYYWLGKLGEVLKVPRKTHAKKDAAKTAEFQRTLGDKLRSLNVAGGKPCASVLCIDGASLWSDPGRAQVLAAAGGTPQGAVSDGL